jgi:hypothetical protein
MEWDQYTSDILRKTDQILIECRPIRLIFDQCLNNIIENLRAQSDVVNKAFKLRVNEYQVIIEKLTKQKAEVRVVLSY